MGETHSQTRCPACGLLAIWKPKKPDNFREEWNKIARDGGARPRVVVVPVPLIDAVKPVSE
jgi:DNA-directed RNA polymerase subunit RPC12/RpoP